MKIEPIQTGILIGLLLIGSLHQVELKKRLDAIQEQIKALRPFPQIIPGDPLPWVTHTNSLRFTTNQLILVH